MYLRKEMMDPDCVWKYAEYSTFYVQSGSSKYKLLVSGYSGNAGTVRLFSLSLSIHYFNILQGVSTISFFGPSQNAGTFTLGIYKLSFSELLNRLKDTIASFLKL